MLRSLLALIFLLASVGIASAAAETYNVTTTVDGTNTAGCPAAPSTGVCSLRAAVLKANAHNGTDVILVPAGTYNLTRAGRNEQLASTGDLDITDAVTIAGAGAASTIIDCNGNDRAFDVFANLSISKVTIRNCNALNDYGGAIFNSSPTAVSESIISNNHAGVSGGGISSEDTLTLTNVTFSGNSADVAGGGLDNTFTANLTNVTFSNNTASTGGGINNDEELNLTNVTISGNTASTGGGLKDTVKGTLLAVTLANNGADVGGNYYKLGAGDGSTISTVKYGIFANATSGNNCMVAFAGELTSGGHNLQTDGSCPFSGSGDLNVANAGLAPLSNYPPPGPPPPAGTHATQTHALFMGSPALDAGATDCPPPGTDQRGVIRPKDANADGILRCDIGSFEHDGVFPTTTTTTTTSTTTTSTTTTTVTTSTTTTTIVTTTTTTTTIVTTTTTTTVTTSTTTTTTVAPTTTTTTTTSTPTTTTTTTLRCGDVNGDAAVNIGDALVVAQYDVGLRVCGQSPFGHPELCDVNNDGGCNIGDALKLAQCDVGLISCNFTCIPFSCP